jgi:hypothetical protein
MPMSYGFSDPMASGQSAVRVSSGGGWKALLGLMVAAAGVGFAGYVYFVPYRTLSGAVGSRTLELGAERRAAEEAAAERDKVKAEMARRDTLEKDRSASEGKKLGALEAISTELQTALGALGTEVASSNGKVVVSFPAKAVFEQPTSTAISVQGSAALRVLGGAIKKADFSAKVKAKLIAAAPPRELAQFRNVGEFTMLRAARIALALVDGGVPPGKIAVGGEAPSASAAARKGKSVLPERLDIEIEPG